MGILKNKKVMLNNKHTDFAADTANNEKVSNDALTININKRCNINHLYMIIIKDILVFIGITALFVLLLNYLLILNINIYLYPYIFLILLLLLITTYSIFFYKNFLVRDNLINDYITRKTEFYEIIYNMLYNKYKDKPERFTQLRKYIDIFPKQYKIATVYRMFFGALLFMIVFSIGLAIIFVLILVLSSSKSSFEYTNNLALINVVQFLMLFVFLLIFFIFIRKPLKIRNNIWYEISLFEKKIVDNILQIIPDDDKNKKQINYPLNSKIGVPFFVSVILSFISIGFYYIIWDYLMIRAKKVYLSNAYTVEDYLAELIKEKENG